MGDTGTGAPELSVRVATPADLRRTSAWQVSHLYVGLFPRLGARFVRHLQASYLTSPFGVALVAEVQNAGRREPVGFLLGSTDERAHVDYVLRHRLVPLAMSGGTAMLRRPTVAYDFLRTRVPPYVRRVRGARQRPTPSTTRATPESGERVAVLTSLVVDPGWRSCGAGGVLVRSYLSAAAAACASTAELVTSGAAGVGSFYESLGWEAVRSSTTKDAIPVVGYRYDLTAPGAGA